MTDKLDQARETFRRELPVEARPAAREAAIANAMATFADYSRKPQGSGALMRLKRWMGGITSGRTTMHSLKLNHYLMAGSSLAVLTFAVVSLPRLSAIDTSGSAPAKIELDGGEALTESLGTGGKRDDNQLLSAEVAKKKSEALVDATGRQVPAESERMVVAPAAPVLAYDMANSGTASGAIGGMADTLTTVAEQPMQQGYHDQGRDRFSDIESNPVNVTAEEPVSTFSIDADTASYSFVRGALSQNVLPQKDAVRVEEMINYFPYDYEGPTDRATPFKTTVTLMPTPWNPDTRLMHIGIKGFTINGGERPRSNLVFLLDTSGSMEEPNKLPLLRNSLKMLVDTLQPDDTVSIVVYAGAAGTVLEPTRARDKAKILAALDNLSAGGSTAGAEGIRQAYNLAEMNFDKLGVNRVILATDGDFNVGITDSEELKSFVERKRETGIYLSVLGFGRGNYNDELMQVLAQNGNGNAAYIDTLNEARKVLVDEATSTLFPIAQDVKIQVEFNPQQVSEYRLIGYETRLLDREDFNNDKVDAGEIGAGHAVTAIYELTPVGSAGQLVDPLRYGSKPAPAGSSEYAFVKLRYKLPGESESKLISEPVTETNAKASTEASFAAAVAGFGQLLRGGQYTRTFTYDDVIALAQANRGKDEFGYRGEFVNLVRMAKTAQTIEPLNP